MLVAIGLALLLGMVGSVAVIGSFAAAFDGPGAVLQWLSIFLRGVIWFAAALLVITLRGPYLRTWQAPGAWVAIIGGMVTLVGATILGAWLGIGQVVGSLAWDLRLIAGLIVQVGLFLWIVWGIRIVAVSPSGLRLPAPVTQLVVGDSGAVFGQAKAAVRQAMRWLITADPRPRSKRVVVGAVAEVASGIVAGVFLAAVVGAADPSVQLLLATWGVLMVLSGIGLYAQVGLARVSSVLFAVPAALLCLPALVLVEGGSAADYLLLALVIATGGLVLYAVGWLGEAFSFVVGLLLRSVIR